MEKSKMGIVVLLLVLAVGFAAVSTTLVLNGTAIFGTNDDDFDVIFTTALIDGVDVSSTTISEDGKTITFETNDLAKADDESVLDFTVTNNSTQYDANITMECVAEGADAEYYEISNTIPSVIVAKSSKDGSVTARLKKVSVNEISETFTCTITASAVERTEEGVAEPIAFIPTYYEFGQPTTVSTTDYTTLGYNVFGGLADDNSEAVCINDGGIFCIKSNDYDNSLIRLKEHFGENKCYVYDFNSGVMCYNDKFTCYAGSNGETHCGDGTYTCFGYSGGGINCI